MFYYGMLHAHRAAHDAPHVVAVHGAPHVVRIDVGIGSHSRTVVVKQKRSIWRRPSLAWYLIRRRIANYKCQ